ncbi:MAG: hypothetical protein ACP5SH_21780 [Syntrophobacteraceae bacterium]
MTLRRTYEAIAPLLFGYFAQHLFGVGKASGLHKTFLVMLASMFIGALVAALSLRTYPKDVATAEAYARRTLRQR